MQNPNFNTIISRFCIEGNVANVFPLGSGHINDTYRVINTDAAKPDCLLRASTTMFLKMCQG